MLGICLTCGHDTDDVEAHHVAGRANYPTLTVPVCGDCHRILSAWQRASGAALGDDAGRTEGDRVRALAVGTLDLFRLTAQRHPTRSLVGSPLATLTGRAFNRLLDLAGPADRPGRWLPDPTQPPTEVRPVGALEQTELDVVVLFATLGADFLTQVGDTRDQDAINVLRTVAVDPDGVQRAWQALQRDQTRCRELLGDLQRTADGCRRLVGVLLTADPNMQLDEGTREDARASIHTSQRLTRVLAALAEQAAQTP